MGWMGVWDSTYAPGVGLGALNCVLGTSRWAHIWPYQARVTPPLGSNSAHDATTAAAPATVNRQLAGML